MSREQHEFLALKELADLRAAVRAFLVAFDREVQPDATIIHSVVTEAALRHLRELST